MINDKIIKDFVESQNLHEDDVERLYDLLSEIKNDEPDLPESDQVFKAFEQLISETKAAARSMFGMAKSMRRDEKLRDLGI